MSSDSATQNPNAFIGKKEQPTDGDLAQALGASKPVWDRLIAELGEQHGVSTLEWKCYSAKSGWALRLLRKKRTIIWLAPCSDHFRAMFILGDKAVVAARESGLPARVLRLLDEAPKYPEGTGLRLEIKSSRDLAAIRKLTAVKLAN